MGSRSHSPDKYRRADNALHAGVCLNEEIANGSSPIESNPNAPAIIQGNNLLTLDGPRGTAVTVVWSDITAAPDNASMQRRDRSLNGSALLDSSPDSDEPDAPVQVRFVGFLKGLRILSQNCTHRLSSRFTVKCTSSRQHFVQNRAKREDV